MNKIKVRITALSTNERKFCVVFMGEKVAVAFDRDSGAKVAHGVRMISGDITSGGSRANWFCRVEEGSVFELAVDAEAFEKNKNRITKWKMEVIQDFSMTVEKSLVLENAANNLE
jgi:hypothetical protein